MLSSVMHFAAKNNSGFGDTAAQFRVYLANRPPMTEYAHLDTTYALQRGEIELINKNCGNGWRKVFNVYAKLLFALDPKQFAYRCQADSWQQFRDSVLLQAGSNTALRFDLPDLSAGAKTVHIIAGRTHAKALLEQGLPVHFTWLTPEFAVDKANRLLVCPYFDYRQLNNEKIGILAGLIKALDD